MAARTKKIRHDADTRSKIQAAQIINRFQSCLEGKIELDAQQVSCGKALLNKILPDLKATELSGGLSMQKNPSEMTDAELAAIATTGSAAPSKT